MPEHLHGRNIQREQTHHQQYTGMHRRSPSAMVKLPRCHQIAWQKLNPLILLRFFYTYADDSTLFQRHGATGNHGVSCLHYLRLLGPPRNPIECGLAHGVGHLRSRAATHTPLSTCGKGFSGPHVLRRPRTRHSSRTERLWPSPKRQNTSQAASPAGQVTIIDPTHPLYGRTLPLLRVHSTQSKARLVVQLPDGRVQWIPRAVTELAASAAATLPHALIAVPTLLPLAQLVCAMLTSKEDIHHETVHALTVPLGESPG